MEEKESIGHLSLEAGYRGSLRGVPQARFS
jgi:hypothetical protein